METWAATPCPKKVLSRAKVRSMYWSTTTKVPGDSSCFNEPTAEIERMSVQPARFSTSMLARPLMWVGVMRWPRPWRGRKTRLTPPISPKVRSSEASPQGLGTRSVRRPSMPSMS